MTSHPLEPGLYYLDIGSVHHIVAIPYEGTIFVTDGYPEIEAMLWNLSFWERGYKIEHWGTGKYASVSNSCSALSQSEAVIRLDDKPYKWEIQKDGDNCYQILVPEKNLCWTGVDFQGVRKFKLWSFNGKKDQKLAFDPFASPSHH